MNKREIVLTIVILTVLVLIPCCILAEGEQNKMIKELPMKLDIRHAGFQTTLLGAVRGVADYYRMDVSDATLYGATGHAFLLNFNRIISPGGPYMWNRSHFSRLAKNLGIEMTSYGPFSADATPADRQKIESIIREALDSGIPCSMIYLENQLITGYDETGFHTAGPWEWNKEFPPRRLTFGTWQELGPDFGMGFYTFKKIKPEGKATIVRESLEYAVDLLKNPQLHAHFNNPQEPETHFSTGPAGYDNWLAGIDAHGSSHGNWWNATVYAECRQYANKYLAEVGHWFPAIANEASALSQTYAEIADGLRQASSRKMSSDAKKALVTKLKDQELATIPLLEDIISKIEID